MLYDVVPDNPLEVDPRFKAKLKRFYNTLNLVLSLIEEENPVASVPFNPSMSADF